MSHSDDINNDSPRQDSDNRVLLKVLGLSYTQIQSGAYALILSEVNGPYRIPVVVGASEARAIAIIMEKVTPPRPLCHDLFSSLGHAFGIRLVEVFIYKFDEGVFYSDMTYEDAFGRRAVIDARASDAIAIAMRSDAPIYTTHEIVDETGFIMEIASEEDINVDFSDIVESPGNVSATPDYEGMELSELEEMLAACIANEEYENASKIKEIIDRRKNMSADQQPEQL